MKTGKHLCGKIETNLNSLNEKKKRNLKYNTDLKNNFQNTSQQYYPLLQLHSLGHLNV